MLSGVYTIAGLGALSMARSRRKPTFILRTERLGPLPLVNHFIQKMGLEDILEKYVPTTDRRVALRYATGLGVLLRSIIVEREPIYRQQETVRAFAPLQRSVLVAFRAVRAERV